MTLDALIDFYHTLTPERVARLPDYYSDDAYFKDPFNEVQGAAAIQRIFTHMYRQVDAPRFIVTDRVADANGAVLIWEFLFSRRGGNSQETQRIRGSSHLKFNAAGKVTYHRDYWDAAEELYMKLPLLGCLMRALQRRLASSPPQ